MENDIDNDSVENLFEDRSDEDYMKVESGSRS